MNWETMMRLFFNNFSITNLISWQMDTLMWWIVVVVTSHYSKLKFLIFLLPSCYWWLLFESFCHGWNILLWVRKHYEFSRKMIFKVNLNICFVPHVLIANDLGWAFSLNHLTTHHFRKAIFLDQPVLILAYKWSSN